MADLYKNTLAAAGTTTLTGLTEHGRVKILHEGRLTVEAELDTDDWTLLYDGTGPVVVVDYVSTKLRLTNPSATATKVRAGQEP
jgi:hypothetical protein